MGRWRGRGGGRYTYGESFLFMVLFAHWDVDGVKKTSFYSMAHKVFVIYSHLRADTHILEYINQQKGCIDLIRTRLDSDNTNLIFWERWYWTQWDYSVWLTKRYVTKILFSDEVTIAILHRLKFSSFGVIFFDM